MMKPIIATYVYSAWHKSTYRHPNWIEWNLIKNCKPYFKGHKITERPLWGYYDDTKTDTVLKQINTAKKYGVDLFIYNFYWDGERPVFEEGFMAFLNAIKFTPIKFCIILSPRLPRKDLPLSLKESDNEHRKKRSIKINNTFIHSLLKFSNKNIFSNKHYFRIKNKPVVYFFQYHHWTKLIKENKAMDQLYSIGTCDYLPQITDMSNSGFSALTSYNMLADYYYGPAIQDYREMSIKKTGDWYSFLEIGKLPYFPSVSLGFDASYRGEWKKAMPRALNSTRYYPWFPVIQNVNPKVFSDTIILAKEFILKNKINPPIINICSWNEWTEGNHLEPGTSSHFAYLEEILKFKKNN